MNRFRSLRLCLLPLRFYSSIWMDRTPNPNLYLKSFRVETDYKLFDYPQQLDYFRKARRCITSGRDEGRWVERHHTEVQRHHSGATRARIGATCGKASSGFGGLHAESAQMTELAIG